MFDTEIYTSRRQYLFGADRPQAGVVLLLGNEQSPMNYEANPYPFRQDSNFLYYIGADIPGLAALLDLDTGRTHLYGNEPSLDEIVWMGNRRTLGELAERSGITEVSGRKNLATDLESIVQKGRPVHFLPPYRTEHRQQLGNLLGLQPAWTDAYASTSLAQAVARQRAQKSAEEIDQLETALEVTSRMHRHAMESAQPGTTERELMGDIMGLAESHGAGLSFRPTCSIRGEVLHNHRYDNTLSHGDLLLVDAGGSSPLHYAGDITRVTPVGGSFSDPQRMLYEAVLDAQTSVIEQLEPGLPFRDAHRHASRVLAQHLIEIGLMHGPADAAVECGAHALFFPHGLGHMLGLDTHDMESLGEDVVGYAPDQKRSDQFGLDALRLARPLKPGFVVTVEPGCYFIPPLISQWRQEKRHADFINYDQIERFKGVGGIRIEDDVLITENGSRVLGPMIPKSVPEVEATASGSSR